mgnify:CR=1 FL=1
MASKRHKTEEIVTKQRQVEAVVYQGMAHKDAIRKVRITKQTFYHWSNQYGGMGTTQFKELSGFRRRTNGSGASYRILPWTQVHPDRGRLGKLLNPARRRFFEETLQHVVTTQ